MLAGCFAVVVGTIHIERVDHPSSGAANLLSWQWYELAFIAAWLLLSVVAWQLWKGEKKVQSSSDERTRSVLIIVTVAILVRLVAVFGGPPQLSDDLWRYVHDGRSLAAGINPYSQTPADLGAGESGDPILDQINHPELTTIYQPTSQVVFAIWWWLHPHELDPLASYTYRLGFVGFDLVIVGLLLGQLCRQNRSVWWSILYAWHPLVISEFAASGHQDVIGVAMLLASLVWTNPRAPTLARACGAGCALALAVAVKPIVMPLVLPLAWAMRQHLRWIVIAGISAAATGLLLYLPFFLWGDGIDGLFNTIGVFVSRWSFNGSLHQLVVAVTGSTAIASLAMVGLLTGILCVATWLQKDVWQTATLFLLVSLFCSSTVYPWYLLWALVLVPIRFDLAVWVFSVTITWSYVVLADIASWQVPRWLLILEYSPVYGALALSVWWQRRSRLSGIRDDF